jgi:hypothetical protein
VPEESHPQIVIACEHDSDARVAKGFATRILLEQIDWFEDLSQEAHPTWVGVLPNSGFLRWHSIPQLYKGAQLPPVLGFIDGKPPKPEAFTTIKALRLAERLKPRATVLMRDLDWQPERREGLLQGRDEFQRKTPNISNMAVVIGTPDRYREAWLLVGFEAKNKHEEKELEEIRVRVESFDPLQEPHRLRDAPGEPRCAKDIWNRLAQSDATRETSCWEQTSLDVFYARGAGCGLSAFLTEIETYLVPAIK